MRRVLCRGISCLVGAQHHAKFDYVVFGTDHWYCGFALGAPRDFCSRRRKTLTCVKCLAVTTRSGSACSFLGTSLNSAGKVDRRAVNGLHIEVGNKSTPSFIGWLVNRVRANTCQFHSQFSMTDHPNLVDSCDRKVRQQPVLFSTCFARLPWNRDLHQHVIHSLTFPCGSLFTFLLHVRTFVLAFLRVP